MGVQVFLIRYNWSMFSATDRQTNYFTVGVGEDLVGDYFHCQPTFVNKGEMTGFTQQHACLMVRILMRGHFSKDRPTHFTGLDV